MPRENKIMLSGGLLATNHLISAVVTVTAALFFSKLLGPRTFAIYSICTSLSGVLRPLSRLGVNACLLTQSQEPQEKDYQNALASMLLSSALVVSIAFMILPLLGHFCRVPDLFWPGVATISLLPAHVLSLPAITRLERGLHFRPVVIIELVGQVLGQALGIGLAFCGWGIWGPLTGGGARAVFQGVAPWIVIGMRPRVSWDSNNALRMIRYGFGFTFVTSLGQGRNFVMLSVIGRIVGPEAVGLMGLTQRVIGLISPIRAAAARLVLPALAPIANNPHALKKRVESAVETELMLSVPITVVAVSIYLLIVPLVLGAVWQPTIFLLPWIAAGYLLASAHATALSVLHIRGFFIESIISTCALDVVLVVVLILSGHMFGVEGCAAASVIVWPMFWIQEWFVMRRIEACWVANGILWAIGGAMVCISWRLGPWVIVMPLVIAAVTFSAIQSRLKTMVSIIYNLF